MARPKGDEEEPDKEEQKREKRREKERKKKEKEEEREQRRRIRRSTSEEPRRRNASTDSRRRSSSEQPRRINARNTNNICIRYIDLVLILLYCISFILMCACIVLLFLVKELQETKYKKVKREWIQSFACIFACGNAMVLLRLAPINWFTGLIHGILNLSIPANYTYCVVINYFDRQKGKFVLEPYLVPATLVIIIIQVILAFHLVVFRPGHNNVERAARAGFHAFLGIVIFLLLVFNHYLLFAELPMPLYTTLMSILLMWYVLFILAIMLTPHFEYEIRKQIRGRVERNETYRYPYNNT